jgi:uncharacterized membrane protein
MEGTLSGWRSKSAAWKILILALVGILLVGWLFNTPAGLLGKADAIGYAVCHRIDLRSFHLGDRQLPLCIRCTGMHLGALLGLVYQTMTGRRKAGLPPRRILVLLGLLAGAFAVDGTNSFVSLIPEAPYLYTPQHWLRLITGTGMGLAMAALLYPAFTQTAWRDWQPQPALSGFRPFAGLALLALLLDLVLLGGNPLLLYPLALLSAAGVLVELTLVYAMIAMMVFRRENLAYRAGQLILPLTGGLGLALLQVAFLDYFRYLLTGTWDGFHIG